jgi:two-component system sensor histidine kinase SenX3
VLNQETNRLNHLIQGLLDMARLDAEFIPDPQAAIDMVVLLIELKAHFGESLQEKRLQWLLSLPDAVIPQVHVGQGHLRTALTHLLDNAIRYSPSEGSLRISVNVRQRTGQMFAVVQICNDGPGIEAAELARVFDRFYRGEVARAWNVPGTGLGLPVTRKIVEQYGGLIELSSQPGDETCFSVWLPLVEGAEWAG